MNVQEVMTMGGRRIRSAAARIVGPMLASMAPEEREFRRIWPMINSIDGLLVSPDQERWLFRMARALPEGSTIVEIGSFKGRSTSCLAFGCKDTRKRVMAIDTFSGNEEDFRPGEVFFGKGKEGDYTPLSHEGAFFKEFLDNLNRCGLIKYVTPVRGRSWEVGRKWNTPINMLFIDGSHQHDDVLTDFELFYPHVVPGGVVAFHDVEPAWPGPFKVWNEVASKLLRETGRCFTLAFGKKPG